MTGDTFDITCIEPIKEKFLATGTRMIKASILPGGPVFTQEATMFGSSPEQAIAHSFYGLLIAKARHRRLNPRLALGLISGEVFIPCPADLRDEDDALYEQHCSPCFGIDVNEKPYLPSNGAEGYEFTAQYCDRCRHDLEVGQEGCEILALALIGEQPEEWRWISGTPTCTKFELPPPPPARPKKPKVVPGQLSLDLELSS
jgi:hypothetical protein